MSIEKLIFHLVTLGASLLCAGTLVEIVVELQTKAAHDTKVGIVSIGDFNRQLYKGNSQKHHHQKQMDEESRVKRSIENL